VVCHKRGAAKLGELVDHRQECRLLSILISCGCVGKVRVHGKVGGLGCGFTRGGRLKPAVVQENSQDTEKFGVQDISGRAVRTGRGGWTGGGGRWGLWTGFQGVNSGWRCFSGVENRRGAATRVFPAWKIAGGPPPGVFQRGKLPGGRRQSFSSVENRRGAATRTFREPKIAGGPPPGVFQRGKSAGGRHQGFWMKI
jgi:hypothetical protein